jgi:hypothetical protein
VYLRIGPEKRQKAHHAATARKPSNQDVERQLRSCSTDLSSAIWSDKLTSANVRGDGTLLTKSESPTGWVEEAMMTVGG